MKWEFLFFSKSNAKRTSISHAWTFREMMMSTDAERQVMCMSERAGGRGKRPSRKVRKMSILCKIIVPVGALIVCICVLLGMVAYDRVKNGMIEMGVEEAGMAAAVAVSGVDGEAVQAIREGSEDSAGYEKTLESMRQSKKLCGIAFLYTLYTDGSKVYYGVDSDDGDGQMSPGEEFEQPYAKMKSVFDGNDEVEDYISDTENGKLISAYKPILNSTGEVAAVMGCDYDATVIARRMEHARNIILVISAICLAAALVILFMIVRGVMKRLRVVDEKIYDLVHNEGDLTQKIDIRSGDELELIADNVNALLEYIRNIMYNISGNSTKLKGSAESVVGNIASARDDITDVSSVMEEMSAAMEETNASLLRVAESVDNMNDMVSGIAEKAERESASSDEIMGKAKITYQEAKEQQEYAKAEITALADSVNDRIEKSRAVEKINGLTEEIISITSQTNLLALNASIEAARAGEAGKGFAVVATEIGQLANNSAEAASQISRVSREVIDSVDELATEAEKMLGFLNETAMSGYEKLLENSQNYQGDVGNLSGTMRQFAGDCNKIRENINLIKEAVDAVSVAVEESTKGVAEVAETSVNLAQSMDGIGGEADANMGIAGLLNDEVGKFKLE